jgi:hypothetical protein
VLFVVWGLIGMGLNMNNIQFGNVALYTLHVIVVLGITGILKERRRHYEKQDG